MKCIICVTFLIGFFVGEISGLILKQDTNKVEEAKLENHAISHRNDAQLPSTLNSDESHSSEEPTTENTTVRIIKRDTLQDLLNKRNRNNNNILPRRLNLLSTERPKANRFQKKLPNIKTKSARIPARQPPMFKRMQDRFSGLKLRMSQPHLRPRGQFDAEEKPNLIEQFKNKKDEFKEKMKQRNAAKTNTEDKKESLTRLQNRIDPGSSKLGLKNRKTNNKTDDSKALQDTKVSSSTTETPKPSPVPVIVLMSSTTSAPETAPVIKSTNTGNLNVDTTETENKKTEKVSSAIERIKEKQKEAVTKIKDRISASKNSSKDNKENVE